MATIFDFNGSGRLGRERNVYQGGSRRYEIRGGVGKWRLSLPEVTVILQSTIRPPTEFQIGAVKLQLSFWRHFDILLSLEKEKDGELWLWSYLFRSRSRGSTEFYMSREGLSNTMAWYKSSNVFTNGTIRRPWIFTTETMETKRVVRLCCLSMNVIREI